MLFTPYRLGNLNLPNAPRPGSSLPKAPRSASKDKAMPGHRVEDLSRYEAIIYKRSGSIRPWLFPCDASLPIEIRPASRLQFDDLDAIADAAVAGMGLA